MIEKIVAPSNILNNESYGTLWVADLESGKQAWVQASQEREKPKWVRVGTLYEKWMIHFQHSYTDDRNELCMPSLLQFFNEKNA